SLSKLVVNEVHPFVISFLIQLIPAVALLPSLRRLRVARSDWKFFALSGVIGTVAGPITYFYGLERTTASNAVFLSNSESLFTMLFAYAFLGERATRREYVALGGIAVGVFSVLCVYAFRPIGAMRTGAVLPTSALWGILVALYLFPNETLSGIQIMGGALMVAALAVFYLFRGPSKIEAAGETLKPDA